jgi:hypothetical protein
LNTRTETHYDESEDSTSVCSQDSYSIAYTGSEQTGSSAGSAGELRVDLFAVFEFFNKITVAFRKGMAMCY